MSKVLTVSQFLPVFQKNTKTKITSYVSLTSDEPVVFSPRKTARASRTMSIPRTAIVSVFGFALVGLSGLLLVTYLFGVNTYAAKGYEVKRLQVRLAEAAEASKKLNLKLSESTSIIQMQSEATEDHFVPVTNVEYVSVPAQFSQK